MNAPRLVVSTTAVAALIAALAPASNASAACSGANSRPGKAAPEQIQHATLCLLNVHRRQHGLRRLRDSGQLTNAASNYAQQMVSQRFFDHVSPSGSTLVDRVRSTGYLNGSGNWSAAENIAWGSGRSATPRRVVSQWMHSAPHRSNILNGSLRDIGVGAVAGSPSGRGGGATYVTDFGRRS